MPFDNVTQRTTSDKQKSTDSEVKPSLKCSPVVSTPSLHPCLTRTSGLSSFRDWARSTVITAGIVILGISLSPKLCALIASIPKPVIGGATLGLFGTITAAGISILSSVDFRSNANSIIVGTSIALGVGAEFASDALAQLPSVLSMLLSNGLFVVAFPRWS